MAKGLINESTLTAIADAIREKAKTTDTMRPSEMAGLIAGLGGGAKMLSGTFKPTTKTKTVQLGQALDLSGNYALFVIMVGTPGSGIANTSMDSGKNLMRAGSVVSWGGSKQCYAQCNSTTATKSNTETWTVNADGSITLPVSYYNGSGTDDVMNFAIYDYQWYFIKG
jgi:hypothetical protein